MTFQDASGRPGVSLEKAVDWIRSQSGIQPKVAIILGSGLGGLADRIDCSVVFPCHDVPGLVCSSVSGHRGQLILGQLDRVPVVAMAGRLHRYEGLSNDEVVFPVRLMAALGAKRLIVSNAAGGVHPRLAVGDIVVIRDHIDLMGGTFGWNRGRSFLSPVRTGSPYDVEMAEAAMRIAVTERFGATQGTYLATLGPTYETRSEYRMMRRLGADVVGMSTVPEVLAADDGKMRVLGLSMESNVANPDRPVLTNHAEVLEAGRAAEGKMEAIVRGVLCTC